MQTKLYDYQEKAANDIFKRIETGEIRGAYLGFDTGTGKTVTALSVAEQLYDNHSIKGLVVICPVSKINDWENDIVKEVPSIEMTFVFKVHGEIKTKLKLNLYAKW